MGDFSEALDSVNRAIIASSLENLHLSDHAHNWIINFLTDRTQSVAVAYIGFK